MDIETLQITQEDIDSQNENYDEGYLAEAKAGDWVYDDGETLCSQTCIDYWYQGSNDDREREKYLAVLNKLKSLNS